MGEDSTSITSAPRATRQVARLSTTALPPERIGGTSYQALTAIVRSNLVTYQQKMAVFGHIAPTVGATWRGYGTTFGAGGSIGSQSESVVQVVYCDHDDCDNTAELPASISAREGSILRLDFMNGRIYAAQNLSGKQDMRGLLGPASFIPMPGWRGILTLLSICAIVAALAHSFIGVLLFGFFPIARGIQRYVARSQRKVLGEYMGRALSA